MKKSNLRNIIRESIKEIDRQNAQTSPKPTMCCSTINQLINGVENYEVINATTLDGAMQGGMGVHTLIGQGVKDQILNSLNNILADCCTKPR